MSKLFWNLIRNEGFLTTALSGGDEPSAEARLRIERSKQELATGQGVSLDEARTIIFGREETSMIEREPHRWAQ